MCHDNQKWLFESYVKAAHSKALPEAKSPITKFESYVKAAHSKAIHQAYQSQFPFESYVKAAHSKALWLNT